MTNLQTLYQTVFENCQPVETRALNLAGFPKVQVRLNGKWRKTLYFNRCHLCRCIGLEFRYGRDEVGGYLATECPDCGDIQLAGRIGRQRRNRTPWWAVMARKA